MDKLELAGLDLGQIFNSRLEHAYMYRAIACITKQHNLKLKTWPKQLLSSLPCRLKSYTKTMENAKRVFEREAFVGGKVVLPTF